MADTHAVRISIESGSPRRIVIFFFSLDKGKNAWRYVKRPRRVDSFLLGCGVEPTTSARTTTVAGYNRGVSEVRKPDVVFNAAAGH